MNESLLLDEYPQLALLAWNRADRQIDPAEAFALYERNWRFVDVPQLDANEQALIETLKHQYGHGVLHV
jgi:hypothetical protein